MNPQTRIEELFEAVSREQGNGFYEDIVPLLHRWPTASFRRNIGYFQEFFAWRDKLIDAHRASFSPDHIRDLTDYILLAQADVAKEEKPEVNTFIFVFIFE